MWDQKLSPNYINYIQDFYCPYWHYFKTSLWRKKASASFLTLSYTARFYKICYVSLPPSRVSGLWDRFLLWRVIPRGLGTASFLFAWAGLYTGLYLFPRFCNYLHPKPLKGIFFNFPFHSWTQARMWMSSLYFLQAQFAVFGPSPGP